MSKAHDGAERKGREARLAGEPATACPYRDLRTYAGRITGSRGFIRAWHTGWKQADREQQK